MTLKIALIGYMNTGKTTLARCIDNRPMYSQYIPTIGINYITHIINHPMIKYIGIWDLSGNPKFKNVISTFILQCSVLVLCYHSIYSLDYIIHNYEKYKKFNKKIILVYTKTDITLIHLLQGYEFATNKSIPFIEISSFNKVHIDVLLQLCINLYLDTINDTLPIIDTSPMNDTLPINDTSIHSDNKIWCTLN